MNERVQTTLRFIGDWPWWAGCGAALLLGGVSWFLYRRDALPQKWWVRALLPSLRALAVMMMVLMLSGPVLHHRKIIGQLSRLLLFVDGSQSMGLTDPSMDLGRKILALERLALLKPGSVPMELPHAGEALAEAQAAADTARLTPGIDTAEWSELVNEFSAKSSAARELFEKGGGEKNRVERLSKDLIEPAKALVAREIKQIEERSRAVQDLAQLGEVAARWQREIEELFRKKMADLASGDSSPVKVALQKFDVLPRWQRVQALLLEGSEPRLLARLAQTYDVELLSLDGGHAERLWQPTARNSVPPTALPKPTGETSDLTTGIKTSIGGNEGEQRGAVVLLTDGQHNDGDSPVELAKVLGGRQMPVFTVGFGSQVRPRDLALIKTEVPDSVFFEDRIQGEIVLKDDLPVGQPFHLLIKDGDTTLWEQSFLSENKQVRRVPFDFPVKELVAKRLDKTRTGDVEITSVPVEVKVSIAGLEGDTQPANNEGSLRFRAVTQKRKILLLDGRPRWETRYLRNLFERDEQWEVNTVIAGSNIGESGFPRGDKPGTFPSDSALLETYDLIVFGEVAPAAWKGDELQWIKDFVAQRGGAITFIDGARGRFKEYAGTPIEPLFPVSWKGAGLREDIAKLVLTERAASLAPFVLASDHAQNSDLWASLRPPHWLADTEVLPGAESFVEAEVKGQRVPAIVYRSFGAGQVFYQAFDDSWRWRYEVADLHHVKYWNQAANWIAELPFAVRDKFISLDAGAITYRPGDSANIRVRLRDGDGKPVTNAAVDAVLYREGKRVATIRLHVDENGGGLYRGKTASLDPGDYEIGIESAAIQARDAKARAQFKVEPSEMGELTMLNLNEDLLRQVSAASGGQYLREEHIDKLAGLLAPMSQGKVIESDTVLWQSYAWFLPLVALLTIEWIVRKRVGML
ncbi:MAG TPA: FixH family protein [Chthoniobacteraceae bacterium]|nr:FixH family protein [Chthoniobacteraceae bacterium]